MSQVALRERKYKNVNQTPLAQITLQVTPNEDDYLEIYEGDDLAEIVELFCQKWQLGDDVKSMLELEMMRQLGESGISSVLDEEAIQDSHRKNFASQVSFW